MAEVVTTRRRPSRETPRAVAVLLCLCLLLQARLSCGSDIPAPPRLRTLGQLNSLSQVDATNNLPVSLRATVTHCDPGWKLLFLQDPTGAAFVENGIPAGDALFRLQRGQVIEIEGVTTPGLASCSVRAERFRAIGQEPMPAPIELAGQGALQETNSARWAKASGWIAWTGTYRDRLAFALVTSPGESLTVVAANGDAKSLERLRGSLAEVTGVFAIKVGPNKQKTAEYLLFISELAGVRLLKTLRTLSPGELVSSAETSLPTEPVRLRAKVMSGGDERGLMVGDQHSQIRIEFRGESKPAQGSSIEVFGFPTHQPAGLALVSAVVQLLDPPQRGQERSSSSAAVPGANANLPELSTVSQVRNLSASESSRSYPVRVSGVLTYCVPNSFLHFVQDDSAGIYLDGTKTGYDFPVHSGQKVEVLGFSGSGDYAPVIHVKDVRVLGDADYPQPVATTYQALFSGNFDSQYVALTGVVRSQSVHNDQTVLALSTGDGLVNMKVPNAAADPAPGNLLDAAVKVRGVCTTVFNDRRRLAGVELQVPGWGHVEVIESAPMDPFALQLQSIDEIFQFHPGYRGLHRARVRGTVIHETGDGTLILQDGSGGVQVHTSQVTPVQPGDAVEAVGFPTGLNHVPSLQEALVKVVGGKTNVAPRRVLPESSLDQSLHATLVRIQARVVGLADTPRGRVLNVQFGPTIVDALIQSRETSESLVRFSPGTVLDLTGVYLARVDAGKKVQAFDLLLRRPEDIEVVARPLWLTTQSAPWVLGGLALFLIMSLGWIGLLRRQVAQRTWQLHAEIDEHKRTESELQAEIAERKRVQEEVESIHKDLLFASRQAGMAEVATSVLHNVGNVLNSANVSANLVIEIVRRSKVASLSRAVSLIREQSHNLGDFLQSDTRGRQLPAFLTQLTEHLVQEQAAAAAELESLHKNLEHVKDIVATQQEYSRVLGVVEKIKPADLIEDALRMNAGALERHNVRVQRDYDPENLPEIMVEKHKVLQILVNLVRNAKYACDESGGADKLVKVGVANGGGTLKISVTDNGVGIAPENLSRIFSYGFTTRKTGHGFGLHSGALAASELGGSLIAQSEGPGKGATFILELPITRDESWVVAK